MIVGLAWTAPVAQAQTGRELNNALKDVVNVWTAPGHVGTNDIRGIATLVAATGVAMLIDEPVLAWVQANAEARPARLLQPFREGGPLNILGRSNFLVGTSAGLFLVGVVADSQDLRNAGRGCASSAVATTLSRHLIARLLGRARPRENQGAFVIRPLAWGDWEMRSFPGGHAANAMTCITFWNRRFDLGVAEPVLYALGSAVGAGRIIDEAHWTSDTVFGLGYGHAVGREVARQQATREPAAAPSQSGVGLRLGYTIRF